MPTPNRRQFLRQMTAAGMVAAGSSALLTGRQTLAADSDDVAPVPLPRVARFERMAYGMFIHWGLYSQLGRGEWVMNREKISKEEYKKLRDTFTAKDFDGRKIARIARQAGMKYITLTSRHHDGFSLYDTRGLTDHDVMHTPAGRDLIKDFTDGCRAEGIVPFLYHTTLDWWQESFNNDFDAYLDYLNKSVEILCTNYGPIGGLWFDGNWSKKDADWKEDRLYATIRKHQPEAIIVNNTGLHQRGKVGNPEIDSVTFEQGRPTPRDQRGMPKYVAGEMCQTMNRHWGLGKNDFAYMGPPQIIENLCACRKVGANYLLNVGPHRGRRDSRLRISRPASQWRLGPHACRCHLRRQAGRHCGRRRRLRTRRERQAFSLRPQPGHKGQCQRRRRPHRSRPTQVHRHHDTGYQG